MTHTTTSRFKLLPSGDPLTLFDRYSAEEVLARYGPPRYLLSQSAKAAKSTTVGVLNRMLYFTSGVFCPAATVACRADCLGHTSGNMQFQSSARARDSRTAWYQLETTAFLTQLRAELYALREAARLQGLTPAVRLNGTSDLPWERIHPELFAEFPEIQFLDYTKLRPRMRTYLTEARPGGCWPSNYHLTFSGDGGRPTDAQEILQLGGNVALVFWPELPKKWWDVPVIDGDLHDARFLDPKQVIVGLKAKGIARVDQSGFVIRPCPRCLPAAAVLVLAEAHETTHRRLRHVCHRCGHNVHSQWILRQALKQARDNRLFLL